MVEEHTAVVDARLEAVALGPAAKGGEFRARLKIGGKVVRVIASRRAGRSLRRKARPGHETPAGRSIDSGVPHRAGVASAGALAKKHSATTEASKATPPEEALRAYIARCAPSRRPRCAPGIDLEPGGPVGAAGHGCQGFPHSRRGVIVVSESLAASTDGQVKNTRASNANSAITSLFGALKASNTLQNLLGANASSGLTAQGQSTTDSSLATTFGAEVVDVLPNGMLVVQATRQLTFSQQTQLINLRGLVRPEDVSNQNQVLSTAMTDLELEVTGKGIVNDSTYRQNPLVRFLERMLVF